VSRRPSQELWLRVDDPIDGPSVVCARADSTLGRDLRNDIVIDDVEASRQHARLRAPSNEHSAWSIIDLETTNGTYVNEERVVGPATIEVGDVLRIGRVRCVVIDPAATETRAIRKAERAH
jgi:pSer/pThr/pTyr-binding forkhead associated (FHA) protein